MRPQQTSLAAAGNSPWLNCNWLQNSFGVSLAGIPTSGANLTWKVQHTFDLFSQTARPVTISRTTTVATVTDTDHRLSVGDSIVVVNSGSTNLDGTYDIATVIDANSYTYTVANSGIASASAQLKSFRVFDHATLVAKTARADGNYAFPPEGYRLVITAYVSGKCDLIAHQGLGI
jgi:hypothetical protein